MDSVIYATGTVCTLTWSGPSRLPVPSGVEPVSPPLETVANWGMSFVSTSVCAYGPTWAVTLFVSTTFLILLIIGFILGRLLMRASMERNFIDSANDFDRLENYLRFRSAIFFSIALLSIGVALLIFGVTGEFTVDIGDIAKINASLPGILLVVLGFVAWFSQARSRPRS